MKGIDYFIVLAWFILIVLFIEVNHRKTSKKLNEIELRQNELTIKIDSIIKKLEVKKKDNNSKQLN